MNRAIASFIALAGLAVSPCRAQAQSPRGEARGEALIVHIHALVPLQDQAGAQGAPGAPVSWQEDSVKSTVQGVPVGVKLLGANLVILTQVTPFDRGDGTLTLVAQGQVWVRSARGGISYRTTIDTVTVAYDETVIFYPLGVDGQGRSPLRVEISVSRGAALDGASLAAPAQASPAKLEEPAAKQPQGQAPAGEPVSVPAKPKK